MIYISISSSRWEERGEREREREKIFTTRKNMKTRGMHLSVQLSVCINCTKKKKKAQKDCKLSLHKQANTKTDNWAFFAKLGQK